MIVHAYIEASYGVHKGNDMSRIECAIVTGDSGLLDARSTRQKIMSKSSTEVELVDLSDSVVQAIHLVNFVDEKSYLTGPIISYQYIMSCMTLMKREGLGSKRP